MFSKENKPRNPNDKLDDLLGSIKNTGDEPENNQEEAQTESAPIPNLVSKIVSDRPMHFEEVDIKDQSTKELGVAMHKGMNDKPILSFDTDAINLNERRLVEDFIQRVEANGKEGLKGSRFEWFFEEESEEFVANLAASLKTRLDELDEGMDDASTNAHRLDNKMASAFGSFREMAKREQLKKAVDKQAQSIPIEYFEAKTVPDASGKSEIVKLYFNVNDLSDPRNEMEYIFVNGPGGELEVVFSCKHPDKYQTIRPKFYTSDQANDLVSGGYFSTDYGSIQNISEVDDEDGFNNSRYEFTVNQGHADVSPIFSKIKVLKKPVDLDAQLDLYVAEQKRKEEERLKKEAEEAERRRRQSSTYSPTPPAAPTPTPRWNSQPTNYSRSG